MSQTTHTQRKLKRPLKTLGLWIAAVVVAAVTAAGCSSGSSPSTTPNATATVNAKGSLNGIPLYHPSSIKSQTGDSAVLTSPDSVTKVSDYYVNVVNRDGWTVESKSVTAYNGNLTIKKNGRGASISIAPSGSSSVITISTYPTA
ncbi:MAG: hypothetical protein LBV34_07325 [Nocardiopsaceae bacterium]|jgi:hypothetical protein|nr:hypothetical protein [Nocardiopsaceae bacterium]